jgi:hypothetical protein
MKIIENPLKEFPTSKMIFKEGVSEKNIEKAIELANQIDYHYKDISNSYFLRFVGKTNRALAKRIFELGCTSIIVPLNGKDSEIQTKFYCEHFEK